MTIEKYVFGSAETHNIFFKTRIPEHTSQKGIRQPRQWIVHKSDSHESIQRLELPSEPHPGIQQANFPAQTFAFRRICVWLHDRYTGKVYPGAN